jgi:hypothetical protein
VGSSARSACRPGARKVQPDARAGAGNARDGEVAPHLRPPVAHGEAGVDQLARVDLVDAHQRLAVRGDPHQPLVHGEGPTAAERLPQLPFQSTTGLSTATWAKV